MAVIFDRRENPCMTFKCPHCGFAVKWRSPNSTHLSRKHEIEIHIDDNAVKKKLDELEKLDFYKKIVAYTRTRQRAVLSISLKKGQ